MKFFKSKFKKKVEYLNNRKDQVKTTVSALGDKGMELV